jgi:hypothetical protein
MANMMRKAGYEVEEAVPFKWQMTRSGDAQDRINRLQDELQQKAPKGIIRTREAEGARLAKIADRIKSEEPEDLHDCLLPIWSAHAESVAQQWVQQDTASLQKFAGTDWPMLKSLIVQALEADRALCMLGMDSCNESAHSRLWSAIGKALSGYLKKMAEGGAPAVRILDVAKRADALGVVSPGLMDAAWAAVRRDAQLEADIAFDLFLKAYNASGKKLGDPSVRAALLRALSAEKAADMVGVEIDRARQYAAPPPPPAGS